MTADEDEGVKVAESVRSGESDLLDNVGVALGLNVILSEKVEPKDGVDALLSDIPAAEGDTETEGEGVEVSVIPEALGSTPEGEAGRGLSECKALAVEFAMIVEVGVSVDPSKDFVAPPLEVGEPEIVIAPALGVDFITPDGERNGVPVIERGHVKDRNGEPVGEEER